MLGMHKWGGRELGDKINVDPGSQVICWIVNRGDRQTHTRGGREERTVLH